MSGEGEVRTFTVDLTRALSIIGEKADLFVKGFTQTVFNEVQSGGRYSPGTPIDTGFARANWYGGIGAEGTAPAITRRDAPNAHAGDIAASQQELAGVALRARLGDQIVLANDAPYIRRLEYGWSSQAPSGMIRLALQNAQAIADEVATHVASMR